MKNPTDLGDWVFLIALFLGGCALFAAFGPSSVGYGARFAQMFVGLGAGIGALIASLLIARRMLGPGQGALWCGWLVGLGVAVPISITLALRVLH